ncbi:GPP34 family phosphoprotein [Microlunatus sp. GCM10028923]|uniref:GOLPH3/VPS74 family protein n=1 Tax=Microlunatus sp. GCM10028923 TaxID=3273400 RepID=UPI003612B088
MLIAERFLLLCVDQESGKRIAGRSRLEPALHGAVAAELVLRGRISITPDSDGLLRRRRLVVVDPAPTGDAVLDPVLAGLVAKPDQKIADAINPFRFRPLIKDLSGQLLSRLVAAGILEQRVDRVLGVFPATAWPTRDPRPDRLTRERLHYALVADGRPDPETSVLVALALAAGLLIKLVPTGDRARLKARAKELIDADPLAAQVRQAVSQVYSQQAAASA